MSKYGNVRKGTAALALLAAAGAASVSAQETVQPKTAPIGDAKSAKTRTLEVGAKLLQRNAPIKGFDIYLVGFHPMKEHPEQQMEAHHYCHQMNEDFAQCMLFDSNTRNANLNGIEYIISEKVFATLPAEEKKYWHPHNGEILSGQLMAPGIPKAAEHALMKKKMNSYGKTWHVWNTGHEGQEADKLPLGEPMLAWSFNRDGEAMPSLIEKRDSKLDVSTAKTRKNRADLQSAAKPQSGVDDLRGKFARPATDIPGVKDVEDKGAGDKAAPAR
jgi:hypothetical protein